MPSIIVKQPKLINPLHESVVSQPWTSTGRSSEDNLRGGLVGAWSPAATGSTGYILYDLSGKNNHGRLTNTNPATDWVGANVNGRSVQALNFDGIDNYVLTTQTFQDPPLTAYLFCKARANGRYVGLFFQRPIATGINLSFSGVNVGYHWNDENYLWEGGPTFPLNINCLIAVTIFPSYATAYAIYNNTIYSGTNTSTHSSLTQLSNINIGRDSFSTLRNFNGIIYEAGLFSRGLSSQELFKLYQLGPGWLARPKQRASVLTVAPTTFTASASLTTGAATCSGSATHTTPTYTATSAITIGAATASGSATFATAVFLASGAVTVGATTASGAATFVAPVYTGTSALTVGAATASASGTVTHPVYTGSAAVTVGAATCSGSAIFASQVFAASAAVTAGAATASGSATFTTPLYTAAAGVTVGKATASGAGTFVAPVYTASAAVSIAASVASGSATATGPTFTASAAVTTGAITVSGAATYALPTRTATGAVVVPAVTASGVATFVAPVYTASAALTCGATVCSGLASNNFVSGPYRVASRYVFVPGATAFQVRTIGAVSVQVNTSGASAAQVF